MADVNLPLRTIHETESIPWWPLAPGWWAAIVLVALLLTLVLWWRRRETARLARVRNYFDADVAVAGSDAERVARISELLRRASRRHVRNSDRLAGAEWLAALNKGMKAKPFTGPLGELLLEGGFRRDVDAGAVDRLQSVSRDRFAKWVSDV